MDTHTHIESHLIHEILALPNAPIILKKIDIVLKKEQQKREHFYNEITEQVKAEFINGTVIIHSPVVKLHNESTLNIARLIDAYVFKNDLGFVGIEKILIQLTRNDYEPDVCFFNKQKAAKFTNNQKFFPAPDLVVEVLSKSTAKRDRGIKFQDYEAHNIQEYWIVEPKNSTIEQYVLRNRQYLLKTKSASGNIESEVLKGFTFPVKAIFDREQNYQIVRAILA